MKSSRSRVGSVRVHTGAHRYEHMVRFKKPTCMSAEKLTTFVFFAIGATPPFPSQCNRLSFRWCYTTPRERHCTSPVLLKHRRRRQRSHLHSHRPCCCAWVLRGGQWSPPARQLWEPASPRSSPGRRGQLRRPAANWAQLSSRRPRCPPRLTCPSAKKKCGQRTRGAGAVQQHECQPTAKLLGYRVYMLPSLSVRMFPVGLGLPGPPACGHGGTKGPITGTVKRLRKPNKQMGHRAQQPVSRHVPCHPRGSGNM